MTLSRDEKMQQLVERGYSTHKIAAALGISQTNVRYHLDRLGLQTVRAAGRTDERTYGVCLECSGPLRKRHQKKFCSMDCSAANIGSRLFESWQAGGFNGSGVQGELSASIRKSLIREAGNACSVCFWGVANPVLGYPILTIDHIDGNWKNNDPANLVVLCFNCHTLTPTFGALNKNSPGGRKIGT